jgi:hypothetical protein
MGSIISEFVVTAYTMTNNIYYFPIKSWEEGRDMAKRMVMEGLWIIDDENEIFYPVHQLFKVTLTVVGS